mgnify:CR=1 FL=1
MPVDVPRIEMTQSEWSKRYAEGMSSPRMASSSLSRVPLSVCHDEIPMHLDDLFPLSSIMLDRRGVHTPL